jgi:hypothetical protein
MCEPGLRDLESGGTVIMPLPFLSHIGRANAGLFLLTWSW